MPPCGAWGSSTLREEGSRTAFSEAVGSSQNSSDSREGKDEGRQGDHDDKTLDGIVEFGNCEYVINYSSLLARTLDADEI